MKEFPVFLKVAKVVPVFNKADKASPENYRPVTLICSISKTFEKLSYNRMVDFFEKNELFTSDHFGPRNKDPAFMQLVQRLTTL